MYSKNNLIQFLETPSPKEIEAHQNSLLQKQLAYLATHSTFYQTLFKKHQIDWKQIKTVHDLEVIPVTTKNDLQEFNLEVV